METVGVKIGGHMYPINSELSIKGFNFKVIADDSNSCEGCHMCKKLGNNYCLKYVQHCVKSIIVLK